MTGAAASHRSDMLACYSEVAGNDKGGIDKPHLFHTLGWLVQIATQPFVIPYLASAADRSVNRTSNVAEKKRQARAHFTHFIGLGQPGRVAGSLALARPRPCHLGLCRCAERSKARQHGSKPRESPFLTFFLQRNLFPTLSRSLCSFGSPRASLQVCPCDPPAEPRLLPTILSKGLPRNHRLHNHLPQERLPSNLTLQSTF